MLISVTRSVCVRRKMDDDSSKNDLSDLKAQTKEDLFEVIGAKDIPDEEKGALLAKMMDVVSGRAIARLGEELTPPDRQKLEELISSGDEKAVDSFIAEKAPNFDSYFEEEAKKLRQELIIELGQ